AGGGPGGGRGGRLRHEQPASAWLRQAEELARGGQFAEAVRALFHAALSQLHQAGLLRCEPTRTNGEYVEQVRRAGRAATGDDLAELTGVFERGWYGGQAC